MIGKTLSHYEIIGLAGKGGMGEVYKARDTRLGRTVAVKILPADVTRTKELKERFEREARMIASLSHPHVCALYDVGSAEGVEFLVMEYLEGETLADRLKSRGVFPLHEAREIGTQIADALDAAHRHGIVHRDLKPGNVMLTASGVKLLDFGLAKEAEGGDSGTAGLTALQTAAADQPLTQEGTILGTLQYMAPEQLEGKRVDARTDIFALGLLLYEMVSGKRAFAGDSQASLIASIMTAEPQSMSEIAPITPLALERLVHACLAKDPDKRVQSAHDVALQLQWIQPSTESTESADTTGSLAAPKRSSRLAWIVSLILAVVAAWLASERWAAGPPANPPTRLSVVLPADLRMLPEPIDLAISPDGQTLAFAAMDTTGTRSLWVRPLNSIVPERIPGTERGFAPFWSADGRHLGFFRPGRLMRVSLEGGRPPQVVCDAPDGRGGTWNQDDVILFAPYSSGGLFTVSASGGTPVPVTQLDVSLGENAHRYPGFLPNGRDFLYASVRTEEHETWMASVDGGEPTLLLKAAGMATYADPGYLIYERRNSLLAVRFDPSRRQVADDPIALADIAGGTRDFFGTMAVRVAPNGTMVYFEGHPTNQLVWLDRQGRRLGHIPVPPDAYGAPQISPDGRRVAVERPDPQNMSDLWLIELDRNVMTRLTFEPKLNSNPIWSRDGQSLTFSSRRGGTNNIYWKKNGGTGPTELLAKMEGVFSLPMDWTPDGRQLLVRNLEPETGNDVLVYSLQEQELDPLLHSPFSELGPTLSRDGQWIAYSSDESGQNEVYVQPFPGLGSKVQVSAGGCILNITRRSSIIFWGPGDQEILYLGQDGVTIMSVPIEKEPTFKAGRAKPLFRLPAGVGVFDTVDNQKFLVTLDENQSQQLVVVTNWTADLEQQ